MKLNICAVGCLNRRYASTNLHGIASQTTVVIIFFNTLMFTVRFVLQSGTILNKIHRAMCDDFVTAYWLCLRKWYEYFYLLKEMYVTFYGVYIY